MNNPGQHSPRLISQRDLLRQLLALAAPVAIGIMVQTSYHVINAFWVGRISADAVAIVAICYPINLILIATGSGLSLGASILIAQRHGANDRAAVNHLAAQALSGLALLALALTAIAIAASPVLLELLGTDDHLRDDANSYLIITLAGSVLGFISMTFQSIMRGLGEARAPLLVIIPSVLLNAVLDPVFIFGWGPIPALGVDGAAWATVLTQLFTAVAGVYLMLRPRFGLHIHRHLLRPHRQTLGQLLKIGFPTSVDQSMGALTVTVITALAAQFGTHPVAAYGILFRLMTFTVIPAVAVAMAGSILIGQSLGQSDSRRANRIALVSTYFNAALLTVTGVVLFLMAKIIAQMFVPNEPELIAYCATALQIFALSYPLMGLQTALTGVFRGAGDTLAVMLMSLIGAWLIQVPLCVVLTQFTPLRDMGLWWSTLIATGLNSLAALIYFRSGYWLRNYTRQG